MAETYIHTVKYYETDKMGVTHHSNYFRWMEDARIDHLGKIGWSFVKLEESGLICPVVSVSGKYKIGCRFGDVIKIISYVSEVKGAKFVVDYKMIRESDGALCFEGQSVHCFMKENGIPLRLKRDMPDFYEKIIKEQMEA